MPKAILEFNLPEDKEEFEMMLNAHKLHSALLAFSYEVLRKLDKYGFHPDGRELSEDEAKIVDFIIEQFYNTLKDHEVEL